MTNHIVWPYKVLPAFANAPMPRPFTRGGGRSIGGIERATRTDRGFWRIQLTDIPVHTNAQRRVWSAIRTHLGGRAGLIAIPVWSHGNAPWVSGRREAPVLTSFSDGASFSDGGLFYQGAITIEMATTAALGATSVQLHRINAAEDLTGIRFSWDHAMYETGPAIAISGNFWTVPIFPAIRQAIPAGATLECDLPHCLARLEDDAGMDIDFNAEEHTRASVSFVEAVDYWSDMAAAA